MRYLLITLVASILAVIAVTPAQAIDTTRFEDPALQERYREITHELRCMQCQNTSIADSQVGLAADLRREVHDLLLQGKTDNEIRDYMVERYGEFILFRPLPNARNMWLWVAPGAFLLIGILIAIRVIRQRSRLMANDNAPLDDEPLEEDAKRG